MIESSEVLMQRVPKTHSLSDVSRSHSVSVSVIGWRCCGVGVCVVLALPSHTHVVGSKLLTMGCRESKTVEKINSDINHVFKIDDRANVQENVDIADRIKNCRKPKKDRKLNKSANCAIRPKLDPKIIAKYEIKAVLGKGQFTKVLRVENKISRKPFALKILEKPEGLETLENEICILRQVTHKQIIKLVEVFITYNKKNSRTNAFVLELTTGGDLFDRLFESGPFLERDAVKVGTEE